MTDWASIAPAVAREILGEPPSKTPREWRWGRKGLLSLDLARGSWHDFSAGEGGGVLALVERERNCDKAGALRWLREQGYIDGHTPRRRPDKPRADKHREPDSGPADERPGLLWDKSAKADGTPAHTYLVRRWAWPPAGDFPELPEAVRRWARPPAGESFPPEAVLFLGANYRGSPGFPPLPGAVRWLSRQAWERERWPWFKPPVGAAGALVCAFRDRGGELRAVSLEALNEGGEVTSPRWRHTFGSRKGAAFQPVPRPEASEVALVEGELDALAGAWLHRSDVYGVGGTSGIQAWEPWDERPILVCPDGDGEGDKAARALRVRLGRARVSVDWRSHGDLSEDLADKLLSSADEHQDNDGLARPEAERFAWEQHIRGMASDPGERFCLTPEQIGPPEDGLNEREMMALLDRLGLKFAKNIAKRIKAAKAAGRELRRYELNNLEHYSRDYPDLFDGVMDLLARLLVM